MRTTVVSFSVFFQELSNKKIKSLRPKMTKIASRGPALNSSMEAGTRCVTTMLSAKKHVYSLTRIK